MRRSIALAAALATLSVFGAGSTAFAKTATVEFADLDLATEAGKAELDRRLDRAARQVCKDQITGSHVSRVDSACVAQARAQIAKQLAARAPQMRSGA